jgi:hypothetical protein
MPSHRHSYYIVTPIESKNFGTANGDQGGLSKLNYNEGLNTEYTGSDQSHNNMPPFYVLVYIIKTSYDFCYNLLSVPSAPLISIGNIEAVGPFNVDTGLFESYNVTINWSPPSNGGSPIASYTMSINDITLQKNMNPIVLDALSNNTIQTFAGGQELIITLTATNAIGESLPSNSLHLKVPDIV